MLHVVLFLLKYKLKYRNTPFFIPGINLQKKSLFELLSRILFAFQKKKKVFTQKVMHKLVIWDIWQEFFTGRCFLVQL